MLSTVTENVVASVIAVNYQESGQPGRGPSVRTGGGAKQRVLWVVCGRGGADSEGMCWRLHKEVHFWGGWGEAGNGRRSFKVLKVVVNPSIYSVKEPSSGNTQR